MTDFRLSNNSNMQVVRKYLEINAMNQADCPEFEEGTYRKGYKSLFNLTAEAIYHDQFEEAAEYLLKWLKVVYCSRIIHNTADIAPKFREFCSGHLGVLPYSDSTLWLPGEHLDSIPYLLQQTYPPNGIPVIDQKWELDTPIPLQFIIDRGMYFLQFKLRRWFITHNLLRPTGIWNLPSKLIDMLPHCLTSPDIESFLYLEGWFQRAIKAGDVSYILNNDDHRNIRIELDRIFGLSISDKAKNVRDRILDFVASTNITNRLVQSMIARGDNCAKRKSMRRRQNSISKTVAVVVPMYKEDLSADEEVSLKHLLHFLGQYDKYLIVPENLSVGLPGFDVLRFPDNFFRSTRTYNKLMLSKLFYETFREYEYILIYQLDSLVLFDELTYWCKQGYDYIGAPWIRTDRNGNLTIYGMGANGGFSLRRVDSFLKVIGRAKKSITKYEPNEDGFWSSEAIKYWRGFRVAPAEVCVRFSFEVSPRFCFEMTNRTLPFGCHAWAKYDRNFWETYLLK